MCLLSACRRAGTTPLMYDGSSCYATSWAMQPAAKHCSGAALQLQQHLLSSCWRSLLPHWQRSWQQRNWLASSRRQAIAARKHCQWWHLTCPSYGSIWQILRQAGMLFDRAVTVGF
jgi:hypothetical protein